MDKQLVFCLLFSLSLSLVGQYRMSTAATPEFVRGGGVLKWFQEDRIRFLDAVYRVGNLNRTIEFYTECFGMQLLRKGDIPEEKYSYAILGFGPEDSHFVLKLIHNEGVDKIDIGTGFGHFGISTQDVYKMVEDVRAKGGAITREPGTEGGATVFAFVQDFDGYSFELTQSDPTPEPISHYNLQVTDMDRAIEFYKKALGLKLFFQYDIPQQFTIAQLGYGEQSQGTNLELRHDYGTTEYTKGNGYKLVAMSTEDVYKSAEAVTLAIKELGGEITRPPCPIPGTNTNIFSFLDPEGFETVLVDTEESLKELHKKG